jgi:hypothetical protein
MVTDTKGINARQYLKRKEQDQRVKLLEAQCTQLRAQCEQLGRECNELLDIVEAYKAL